MEHVSGSYWKSFHDDFEKKYFQYLANDALLKIRALSSEEFFDCPHILFYGNTTTILKLVTQALLGTILKTSTTFRSCSFDVVNNNNKYACPYRSCNTHIEIDMADISSSEKQFVSEFVCNHIAKTRNMFQRKHVVVMHNTQTMSQNSMFAMRRPIERFSASTQFIFTSPTLSNIEPSILSRFMCVRCDISEASFISFFERFAEDHDIPHDLELTPRDGVVANLVRLEHGTRDMSTLELNTRNFLNAIFKEKNVLKACEVIRAFGYKVLHFNLDIATVMRTTLYILGKTKGFEKKMHDIIALSADLEAKSKHVSKNIVVLEHYYLAIYRMGTST
jgi:hypothetical protein